MRAPTLYFNSNTSQNTRDLTALEGKHCNE